MEETRKTTVEILKSCGAVATDGHYVFTSGKHGDAYVNKDALYLHPATISMLCKPIAERFVGSNIDVVVGPEKGGIILSQWTAYHLSKMEDRDIPAVFAEKEESLVLSDKNKNDVDVRAIHFSHGDGDSTIKLYRGEKLVKKNDQFTFKRGYDAFVRGKKVLIVEDILNTYKTVNNVVDAVKAHGGFVVGVGALCDRSDPKTKVQIHFSPRTIVLARMPLSAWNAHECPLCAKDIPVCTNLGKGAEFLAAQKSA